MLSLSDAIGLDAMRRAAREKSHSFGDLVARPVSRVVCRLLGRIQPQEAILVPFLSIARDASRNNLSDRRPGCS